MMAQTISTNGVALNMLLEGMADIPAADATRVSGLSMDSRRTRPGDLFLACHGTRTSGTHYLQAAVDAGAAVIAAEADADAAESVGGVPVIAVNDLRHKAGVIAARFYGHPSERMNVVGITGTNGKTSVASFIAQALSAVAGHKAGLIGTLGYGPYTDLVPGPNTTPDPVTVQQTLAEFVQQGMDTAIMEVTSIGLDQGRVIGVDFNLGILTNLTVDHLDYHGDMQTYAEAKKQLFTSHGIRHAIINLDDAYGRRLAGEFAGQVAVTGYGLVDRFPGNAEAGAAQAVVAVVDEDDRGMTLAVKSPWGEAQLNTALSGRYNAHNLLAGLAALCLLDIPFEQAVAQLSRVTPVPGRLERFGGRGQPAVYVDYAHTPDALQHVLNYLRAGCAGKLVCVFGCGGDRDKTKRATMGAIAEDCADLVILTNDNPRFEDPVAIIQDILAGVGDPGSVQIQADRSTAITSAIQAASPGDIVLIAGKGHETYQEIAGRRYPFSDRQLVRNLLGSGA